MHVCNSAVCNGRKAKGKARAFSLVSGREMDVEPSGPNSF